MAPRSRTPLFVKTPWLAAPYTTKTCIIMLPKVTLVSPRKTGLPSIFGPDFLYRSCALICGRGDSHTGRKGSSSRPLVAPLSMCFSDLSGSLVDVSSDLSPCSSYLPLKSSATDRTFWLCAKALCSGIKAAGQLRWQNYIMGLNIIVWPTLAE